jgi:uncharacterized protein YrrD
MSDIQRIEVLIGRPVLSVDSANKVGEVYDLIVHPTEGELIGLCVQVLDQSLLLVDQDEIHSIGPDAVMVQDDESLVPANQSPLKAFPLAKNNLIGVEVFTEDGKSLGEIASIYFHLDDNSSLFIYEVRSSILDKILGHSLYFPASSGCAFADDATRLVVSNETENADRKLDAVVARLFPAPSSFTTPEVSVRSHSG